MPVSDPRSPFSRLLRAVPAWMRRLVPALLVSAAVAVLAIPAARSASPTAYRSQQWMLGALHVTQAWGYSRGRGVTVAVLDTGVDPRQADLTGRVVDGPDLTGGARAEGGRYWGRHGTSMASLIAGHGHGRADGVMGVAPEAKILSIRVAWELNDPARGRHTRVDQARTAVAKGIRYAADHGAQVISMSLGAGAQFYDGNPLEAAAIKYALRKGVVLVASAGNDGAGADRRTYPAAYPGVIAVGAVDRAFQPAGFTNRHTYVSVAAPGVGVISADVSGQGYVRSSGTSVSAALVAGMSALIKARYPRLTPAEVKQALEQGATHRPPGGRSSAVGAGVVDAFGGLRAAALINRAKHGGVTGTAPPAAPAAADQGPDVVLIAVLSGGGTLLVLSFTLGWWQRRRRPVDVPHTPWLDESPWRLPEADHETSWRLCRADELPSPMPGPLEPYDPPANGEGRLPSTTGELRVAGEPDPPSGEPAGSFPDTGTPLADDGWEGIHRAFEKLKEDARNWDEVPAGDTPPARDTGDDTVKLPVIRPEGERGPGPWG